MSCTSCTCVHSLACPLPWSYSLKTTCLTHFHRCIDLPTAHPQTVYIDSQNSLFCKAFDLLPVTLAQSLGLPLTLSMTSSWSACTTLDFELPSSPASDVVQHRDSATDVTSTPCTVWLRSSLWFRTLLPWPARPQTLLHLLAPPRASLLCLAFTEGQGLHSARMSSMRSCFRKRAICHYSSPYTTLGKCSEFPAAHAMMVCPSVLMVLYRPTAPSSLHICRWCSLLAHYWHHKKTCGSTINPPFSMSDKPS